MSNNERIYRIGNLLRTRRFVGVQELLNTLEISRATLKRDIAFMRDRMNVPIVHDRELGGYRIENDTSSNGQKYELPGLWFSAQEIYALLAMHQLLTSLDSGGLLGGHIQPLLSRLSTLLSTADNQAHEVTRRIKIEMIGMRQILLECFEVVGYALLKRKKLSIEYFARGTGESTQRILSPQRMIFYRGNWYLDAWCHLRNNLRSFSVDAIKHAEILDKPAKEVPDKKLDSILGAGYGIFSGQKVTWATLIFSPEIARWVSKERWHPKQRGRLLNSGSFELKIPYSKDTELLMDILKYGSGVRVVAPQELISHVSEEIKQMSMLYQSPTSK